MTLRLVCYSCLFTHTFFNFPLRCSFKDDCYVGSVIDMPRNNSLEKVCQLPVSVSNGNYAEFSYKFVSSESQVTSVINIVFYVGV